MNHLHNRSGLKNSMEHNENALLETLGLTAVNGLARSIRWLFTPDKKEKKAKNSNKEEIRIISSDEYDKIRRSILSGEGEKEEVHELVKKERNNTAIFISGLSVAIGFIAFKRIQKRKNREEV